MKTPLRFVAFPQRFSRWAAAGIYAALVFGLSSLSHPFPGFITIEKNHVDKILHAIEYAVLSFLLYRALQGSLGRLARFQLALIVFLVAGAYAFSDEWHQSFVPGRDSSSFDALADHLGILLGLGATLL
ncbi:MAG TPA: VanZ family protein [Candidatus Eisenbacteria bacterium]|jgi:VanZ family protein|nr:VanZ family protein [Candidatus Eisenbacteria bacterium]